MATGGRSERGVNKHCPECGEFYGLVQTKADYFNSEEFAKTKQPGEIRISKRTQFKTRYATMRIEDAEVYEVAKEKGELLVRSTPSGTRQIKARFFEASRNILTLTLQRWTADEPYGPCSFILTGREVEDLVSFIRDIQRVKLPAGGKLTVEQGAIDRKSVV